MTDINKSQLFNRIEEQLQTQGFIIEDVDQTRPWGGFLVIQEDQAQAFANIYFQGIDIQGLKISGKLSPKILIVAPQKRLSWQYHHRRAEIWQVYEGEVGVVKSLTDVEEAMHILQQGDVIRLAQGERHRLVGLSDYGVVAEIWQHTDPEHPSEESDIVRLQDDFGR